MAFQLPTILFSFLGLLPDVKLDVYFPGFPTLKHVPHSVSTFVLCYFSYMVKM